MGLIARTAWLRREYPQTEIEINEDQTRPSWSFLLIAIVSAPPEPKDIYISEITSS